MYERYTGKIKGISIGTNGPKQSLSSKVRITFVKTAFYIQFFINGHLII